jgi:ABC-2 type transport system ATP-binding protein
VKLTQAISVERLSVNRGDRPILDDIGFEVAPGEIVGLLGPNGAGKTTTLGVLSTLIAPASGEVHIAGHDLRRQPEAVRRSIGRVPQEVAVYPMMTARENVIFFGRLLGMRTALAREACLEVLENVGLMEHIDEPAATFSGGMRRRLSLACGLLGSPPVLLLDEPTVGVDPQSRDRILAALRAYAEAGSALLYSTHLLGEAEQLCDRVVLIDHGRVIAAGTPATLIRNVVPRISIDVVTERPLPACWLDGLDGVSELPERRAAALGETDRCHARVSADNVEAAPEVLRRAVALGGTVIDFYVHRPSLEDAFLALTGRAFRDLG